MSTITVHAGDFPKGKGTVMLGMITLPGSGFTGRTFSVNELETVEIATEESVKRVAGTVGWGAAGAVILGPVGLLAGLLLGGRKTEVTFVARFKDGRTFLGTAETKAYKAMLAGAFGTAAAKPVTQPKSLSVQAGSPRPEVRGDTKRKDIYEILEVSQSASKEVIDSAYGALSRELSALAETGNAEAQGKLTIIKSAYEILSNPRQKALYDERLDRGKSTSTSRPIVAADTKSPSDCPKCGSKNCKPASAVYKLFGLPESRRPTSSSGEPADDTPKGQFVSATERIQLYKASAPPNSFMRTSVLLIVAVVSAPAGWFFGPQWFILFAMLGIAAVVAYFQDSKRDVTEKARWKRLVMCMQCGHVFSPNAADVSGIQRETQLAKLRKVEKDANTQHWKVFGSVTMVVCVLLVAISIIWPQRPRTDAITSASSTAPSARLASNSLAKCDKESAYGTQEKISEFAAIEETAVGVRYTLYANSWAIVRPRLDEFVHAIANTDACIIGKARRIDIYGPYGQVVGFADPMIGIRVSP